MSDRIFIPASPGIRAVYVESETLSAFVGETVIAWKLPTKPDAAPEPIGANGAFDWADRWPVYVFPDGHVECEFDTYRSVSNYQRSLRRSRKHSAKLQREREAKAAAAL